MLWDVFVYFALPLFALVGGVLLVFSLFNKT